MRRYAREESHPHPSSYRSYHNSDINQLFHSVRDAVGEPFTITDIDLVVEQHRQFRGLIEIKDNGYEVHYYLPIESERYDDIAELAEFSKYAELPTYSFSKAMLNAVGDLVKCIRKGGQPKCTGEDGVRALKLMEVVR